MKTRYYESTHAGEVVAILRVNADFDGLTSQVFYANRACGGWVQGPPVLALQAGGAGGNTDWFPIDVGRALALLAAWGSSTA